MINISFGKPKVVVRKTDGSDTEVLEYPGSIFTWQNLVLVGAGVSLGIIMKQQSDINSLKRTVDYLQGVMRLG
jgi:hypothetical protein